MNNYLDIKNIPLEESDFNKENLKKKLIRETLKFNKESNITSRRKEDNINNRNEFQFVDPTKLSYIHNENWSIMDDSHFRFYDTNIKFIKNTSKLNENDIVDIQTLIDLTSNYKIKALLHETIHNIVVIPESILNNIQ